MRAGSARLVVLSGPSGVGKTPLARALARFFPELSGRLRPVVLYNSREPRPGERDGVDYHFRAREAIMALGESDPGRYVVKNVRGDTQALDLEELERLLSAGDPFFEGNPLMGKALVERARERGVPSLSIFVSPLSGEELRLLAAGSAGRSPEAVVTEVMRRKLLRRTRRQRGALSAEDLEEVERRCRSAWREIGDATAFSWIIPNHDGEDSENWEAFGMPLGDARRALLALAALLEGADPPEWVERWAEFPGRTPSMGRRSADGSSAFS